MPICTAKSRLACSVRTGNPRPAVRDLRSPSWIDGRWMSMNGIETRTTCNAERWFSAASAGMSSIRPGTSHPWAIANSGPETGLFAFSRSRRDANDFCSTVSHGAQILAGNISLEKLFFEFFRSQFPAATYPPSLAPDFRYRQDGQVLAGHHGVVRGRREDGHQQYALLFGQRIQDPVQLIDQIFDVFLLEFHVGHKGTSVC